MSEETPLTRNLKDFDPQGQLESWLSNPDQPAWDNVDQLIVIEELARTSESSKPTQDQLEYLEKQLFTTLADGWVKKQSAPLFLLSEHQIDRLIDAARLRTRFAPSRNDITPGSKLYPQDRSHRKMWTDMVGRLAAERDQRFPQDTPSSPKLPAPIRHRQGH